MFDYVPLSSGARWTFLGLVAALRARVGG